MNIKVEKKTLWGEKDLLLVNVRRPYKDDGQKGLKTKDLLNVLLCKVVYWIVKDILLRGEVHKGFLRVQKNLKSFEPLSLQHIPV